jgi:hypothetical protein
MPNRLGKAGEKEEMGKGGWKLTRSENGVFSEVERIRICHHHVAKGRVASKEKS